MGNHSTPDPSPYSRPLTRDQVEAARALVDVVVPGEEYSSAGIMDVVRGSSWVLIELAHPTKPDGTLVFVVPARNGPQREPMSVGFAFTATAATSTNRRAANAPRPLRDLAKAARGGIERLLDALGWPAEEMVLHRAIDTFLKLEEGETVRGEETDARR